MTAGSAGNAPALPANHNGYGALGNGHEQDPSGNLPGLSPNHVPT